MISFTSSVDCSHLHSLYQFYYVITCAAPDESFTETMKASLDGFACCVPDAVVGGTLLGTGTNECGDVENMPVMKEAYEMGKAI